VVSDEEWGVERIGSRNGVNAAWMVGWEEFPCGNRDVVGFVGEKRSNYEQG